MGFLDICHKNFLFLGVLLEIVLETLVTDELLFEFNGLLTQDRFGVEGLEDRLASGLEPADLVPDDGDAFKHVFTVKDFGEFSLDVLNGFDGVAFIRLD